MSEFIVKTLLGNILLISTNKLFKNPSGLIFECCGIARAVPIEIHETVVHLDFHIFAILEFDLLIGYPFEKLLHEKPSHGSLNEKLGKTASVAHPVIPIAEHHPNNDPFEEVKCISPFISLKLACETEPPSSPRSNISHVPLTIRTLFSMVVKIQC
jgi:hypothetical protein